MAIDRNKTEDLINEIDNLFDTIIKQKELKIFIKEKIMSEAYNKLEKLIKESRPPKMYFLGRSGHGKSSLINALSNKKVAEVGGVKPTTKKSEKYTIVFEDTFSTWDIIDSRGLFETTSPEGGERENVKELIIEDLKKYKPDILIHVMAAPEVRNMSNDFDFMEEVKKLSKNEWGMEIPTLVVLTKTDTLGNPREWPPEEYPKKAGQIKELLEYIVKSIIDIKPPRDYESIDKNNPIKGYSLTDETYVGIIPVSSYEGELWNIETLSEFMGNHLPENTLLDFFQAQKRKTLLKNISTKFIKRFAKIAAVIGTSPIPVSDIFVLTPLQYLMIAIIGGLSCRSFTMDTVTEYLTAMGITTVLALAARELARWILIKYPVIGEFINGEIAALITHLVGKSAEAYFFKDEKILPEEFKEEAKKLLKNFTT